MGRVVAQPGLDLRAHVLVERAQRAAQDRVGGDDVVLGAAHELADGEDGRRVRGDLARDQVLHAEQDVGGGRDRILREVRIGAVAAPAPHLHVEEVGRGHRRPRADVELAGRRLRRQVQAVDLVDARPFEHARLDHRLGPAEDLLGRLEDEHRRPRHLGAMGGQDLGQGDGDRRVAVVAAGVHDAAGAGDERRVELLDQRQRVDVGAPGDGAPRPLATQHADHAGAADARAHVELGGVQPIGDDLRRPPLLERQLGMAMEVAAQHHQAVAPPVDLLCPLERQSCHGSHLAVSFTIVLAAGLAKGQSGTASA